MGISMGVLEEFKVSLRWQALKLLSEVSGRRRRVARIREPARKLPCTWAQVSTPIRHRVNLGSMNSNRIETMRRAADSLTGLLIGSGEIFDFWELVPRPTAANGYREGPTLINGRLTPGYGGGLCQISTTLYQVFLYCNLEVLERSNHSVDIHGGERFFQLGQDAAVAWGYKNLVVRNDSGTDLQLEIQVDQEGKQCRACIRGQLPNICEVRVSSDIMAEIAPTWPGGMPGWRVKTTRAHRRTSEGDWRTNLEITDTYRPTVRDDPYNA